ncbi:hypothetical protein [Roseovarius nitratireducens]|uniref:hypothetical protein n=1 Tax=Roseovarius nitratireducens TaxID=2044597 RepID=UPI000CE2500F|nr:hypothetical protein [Roseovarius nitratireducens]
MMGPIKDWRAWFTVAILIGYVAAFETARQNQHAPLTDEEIERVLDRHVARCELMKNERTGYACDT